MMIKIWFSNSKCAFDNDPITESSVEEMCVLHKRCFWCKGVFPTHKIGSKIGLFLIVFVKYCCYKFFLLLRALFCPRKTMKGFPSDSQDLTAISRFPGFLQSLLNVPFLLLQLSLNPTNLLHFEYFQHI